MWEVFFIHNKVKLSSLYFESFQALSSTMFLLSSHLFVIFILLSCWIFLVVGIAGSTVESAWKSRWWVSLEELMISSWKGVESSFGVVIQSSLQTAQMVDVEAI